MLSLEHVLPESLAGSATALDLLIFRLWVGKVHKHSLEQLTTVDNNK